MWPWEVWDARASLLRHSKVLRESETAGCQRPLNGCVGGPVSWSSVSHACHSSRFPGAFRGGGAHLQQCVGHAVLLSSGRVRTVVQGGHNKVNDIKMK